MSTIKEKQLAFLEETVNHYNSTNRCVNTSNGECYYHPATLDLEGVSQGCAIGRHLDPELAKRLDIEFNRVPVSDDKVFVLLPDNLKELGEEFLSHIQLLHDTDPYWNTTGLSKQGEIFVDRIKEQFGL